MNKFMLICKGSEGEFYVIRINADDEQNAIRICLRNVNPRGGIVAIAGPTPPQRMYPVDRFFGVLHEVTAPTTHVVGGRWDGS